MEEGLDQKFNKTQLRMNIFHIVWPVFIEVLLGSLFGMVDMMMVGRIKRWWNSHHCSLLWSKKI